MNVTFRAARESDAPALATLVSMAAQAHYSASGYELTLGGLPDHQRAQIACLAMAPSPSWFHHSHFLIAEAGGNVIACAAGFERHEADSHIPAALAEIGWTPEAIDALGQKLLAMFDGFPEEPTGYWTIDHVATLPDFRRQGIAARLIHRILAKGRAAGFSHAKLEVFRGNPAIQLYESLGFRITDTYGEAQLRRWLDRDPLRRMTISL